VCPEDRCSGATFFEETLWRTAVIKDLSLTRGRRRPCPDTGEPRSSKRSDTARVEVLPKTAGCRHELSRGGARFRRLARDLKPITQNALAYPQTASYRPFMLRRLCFKMKNFRTTLRHSASASTLADLASRRDLRFGIQASAYLSFLHYGIHFLCHAIHLNEWVDFRDHLSFEISSRSEHPDHRP